MSGPRENLVVNFRAHELNTGSAAGARADFEQMVAQLVDVFYPGARQVSANPGDGGIDVFHGRLDGRIIVWQSKYFMPQVVRSHRDQIRESFASAQKNARAHGYVIDEWILCVPSSMDHPTTLWWDGWRRAQEAETSTRIDIWDETGLRSRLAQPAAGAVLAAYYPAHTRSRTSPPGAEAGEGIPASGRGACDAPEAPLATGPFSADRRPRAGETARIAGCDCLLQGDPQESRGDGWVLRTGAAMVMSARPGPAWFRQVLIRRHDPQADEQAAAIETQLRLLDRIGGRNGLPRKAAGRVGPGEAAVVSARPAGRTWRDVFGPVAPARARPLDRVTAAALLAVAAAAADVLTRLHDTGHSHRALTPDAVVLPGPGGGAALRDLGLAAVARQPDEGPAEYRSPEQERLGLHGAEVGFRTDACRLAAMTYHCLTGRPPALGSPLPLRAFGLDLPDDLEELLSAALDPDPGRRPALPGPFVTALRAGSDHLGRVGR
ncbi:serine/threonine protein kinase [Frankia sp. CcI49]|uniref:serine/threonine protein kinase n=2 Tax=unclassified Frankia TaxID=2632575 RepID=UPI0009783940|nr:serine/threonine protein kinase [Frankia sp. CcI49]ONH59853.1 serine/threonine protein kinase [Frankia sp. CcI49]